MKLSQDKDMTTMTEKDKQEYREYLDKLADSNSSEMFSNGGMEHAVILYSVLMSKASKICRFYCEGCNSEIWKDGGFRYAMIDALSRNSDMQVKILTRQNTAPDFSWIPQNLRDKVSLVAASDMSNSEIKKVYRDCECNFSMFDNMMFRYEYDINAYKAFGSFNNPLVTSQMIELFDKCYIRDLKL